MHSLYRYIDTYHFHGLRTILQLIHQLYVRISSKSLKWWVATNLQNQEMSTTEFWVACGQVVSWRFRDPAVLERHLPITTIQNVTLNIRF